MAAIRDIFYEECEEQLSALEAGLLTIEGGDRDPETVNAVFRAVHSIKGGAGAFGLEPLVRFAHVFETALDDVRSGRLTPDAPVVKVMLRAADVLADLVRVARDGGAEDPERDRALVAELSALSSRPSTRPGPPAAADEGLDDFGFRPVPIDLGLPAVPGEQTWGKQTGGKQTGGKQTWAVRFRPHAALYANGNETAVLLRELGRLGTVTIELDAGALPAFPDLDPEGAYLAWTVLLTTALPADTIREVFEFVEGYCDLEIQPFGSTEEPEAAVSDQEFDIAALIRQSQVPPAHAIAPVAVTSPAKPVVISAVSGNPRADEPGTVLPGRAAEPGAGSEPASPAKGSIRVDLDRVDRLIDLAGELVINHAMLAQRVSEAGFARSSAMTLGLTDLEQLTREVQDSVMAIRAQPVKSVFQRMPRLVREVAAMTGKPVRLVTEGEATEVDKAVIEHLTDPLTHMIRNAIDHGLEPPAARQAAGKPAEGTVRLSARHSSGRIVIEVGDDGAGIDRVRVRESAVAKGIIAADAVLTEDEIDNLIFMPGFSTNATVSDLSGRGVGMDVVKRSIQALGGRVTIVSRWGQGSTFIMSLPLTLAVLDGMVVSAGGPTLVVPLTAIIETLQPRAENVFGFGEGAAVIAIRGSYIPLVDVGTALGHRVEPLDPASGVALLIEGEGGTRAALLVDAIQGQRQVVIKSLETNYRRVPGIAAATILGDGRVALILDVDAVVATAGGPARPEPIPTAGLIHA